MVYIFYPKIRKQNTCNIFFLIFLKYYEMNGIFEINVFCEFLLRMWNYHNLKVYTNGKCNNLPWKSAFLFVVEAQLIKISKGIFQNYLNSKINWFQLSKTLSHFTTIIFRPIIMQRISLFIRGQCPTIHKQSSYFKFREIYKIVKVQISLEINFPFAYLSNLEIILSK